MKAYLDSSVILRKLLGEPGALKEWGSWVEGYTSEITGVESLRTLDRLRLEGRLEDAEIAEKMQLLREVLDSTGGIALNAAVLERASRNYPTVLGTLDAIHLASAVIYLEQRRERLVILTHDLRLAIAAQALGFDTLG